MNLPTPEPVIAPPIRRGTLMLFALPAILQAFMLMPAGVILQTVYARESGIALATLGVALMVVRLLDIASDLLIGRLSDRSAQRGISRKRWMVAGTLVTVLALWFLFRPPGQVSVWYFAFWFWLANIGWSLVEIPYRSWTIEFTPDVAQRTRIVTYVATFTFLGGLLFYSVAPLGKALGLLDSAEYNLQMLGLTAIVVVLFLPVLNFISFARVPDTQLPQPQPLSSVAAPRESWALLWKALAGNPHLLRLFGCYAIASLALGLGGSVSLIYMTNYLLLGSSANTVMALSIPLTMLGIPFWGWMATRFPRQKLWSVGLALSGLAYAAMSLYPPQPNVLGFALMVSLMVFCVLAGLVAVPVLLGDAIDYGKATFGIECAGLYQACQAQAVKGLKAISGGSGLILLGWLGFDATKSGAELTPQAVIALKWVAAWLPGIGFLLSAALIWLVPIGSGMQKPKPRPAR
ncbi:MAG TPA: MFS transporter [Fontimonas sp.]